MSRLDIIERKAAKSKATGKPVCPVVDCYGIMKVYDHKLYLLECLVCGVIARTENVMFLRTFTRKQANEGLCRAR